MGLKKNFSPAQDGNCDFKHRYILRVLFYISALNINPRLILHRLIFKEGKIQNVVQLKA